MISKSHSCIFVHVPKAGGQSIESVFLDEHGLTWKQRAPLLLRRNPDRAQGPERLAHLFAHEYAALGHVTAKQFRDYFKFALVRDPYKRAVSEFNYKGGSGAKTIRDFVARIPEEPHTDAWRHICPQHLFLTDPGTGAVIVDEVIKLEELGAAWPSVSRRLFGREVEIPHANKSKTRAYPRDLSPEDRDFIAERYARDFKLLGYAP